MVPVTHSQRSPVLLFMGGGMGVRNSTDVIYQALNSTPMAVTATFSRLLTRSPVVDRSSSLLVTALNEGRDVIMNGTLSWVPFVEQTIAMVRSVHKCKYRMGVGYRVEDDGTIIEIYWEPGPDDEDESNENEVGSDRKPYRIELVGVVCEICNLTRQLSETEADRMEGWRQELLIEPEEYKCLTNVRKLNANTELIYELYLDPSPIFEPGSVWHDFILSNGVGTEGKDQADRR